MLLGVVFRCHIANLSVAPDAVKACWEDENCCAMLSHFVREEHGLRGLVSSSFFHGVQKSQMKMIAGAFTFCILRESSLSNENNVFMDDVPW